LPYPTLFRSPEGKRPSLNPTRHKTNGGSVGNCSLG
jgi:hypothetical protein